MSKSPRALRELMTAVDASHVTDVVRVDSASWDSSSSSKLLGPARRRRSTAYYDGRGGARKSAPLPVAVAVVEPSSDASFEFSTAAVASYSPASPASMVFSDGQLCAHQFPAVRSTAGQATTTSPPVLRSSSSNSGSYRRTGKQPQAAVTRTTGTGSKKRVSFATDGADKAAAAAEAGKGRKKSGGILGCMGSPCGASSRNDAVVEPVARNDSRKMVAF